LGLALNAERLTLNANHESQTLTRNPHPLIPNPIPNP